MTRVEAFAASLPQEGHSVNQDAFWIRPGDPVIVALADGAGAAEQAARRVVRQFDSLIAAGSASEVESFPAWSSWLRALDGGMVGAAQSTFVALAVLEDRVVGASVGDSRAYLWSREGLLQILTEGGSKLRLGSGRIKPSPIYAPLHRGDIVLLMSDGAWTPLAVSRLRDTIAAAALGRLADLPEVILREASRTGVADDMTVVVARRR